MSVCKTLASSPVSSAMSTISMAKRFRPPSFPFLGFSLPRNNPPSRSYFSHGAASPLLGDESSDDTVEELLTKEDKFDGLMKMERRRSEHKEGREQWFPYLDLYRVGSAYLTSGEVIKALDPYILDARKERMRRVVDNRSYSVSLVVEGLTDLGNVSAAFRSADALGMQSVHVISNDSRKRCSRN